MKKKLITVLLILMGLLSSVEANAQRFGSLGKAGEGLLKTPEIMSHAARKATKSNSVSSSFKNNQIWKGEKQTFTGTYWGTTAGLITPARKVEWPTATTLSDNWKKLDRRILDYDIKKKYEKSTREQVMSLALSNSMHIELLRQFDSLRDNYLTSVSIRLSSEEVCIQLQNVQRHILKRIK